MNPFLFPIVFVNSIELSMHFFGMSETATSHLPKSLCVCAGIVLDVLSASTLHC